MTVSTFPILFVDDHQDTREMYAQVFTLSGFSVLEAEDGATALAKAGAEPLLSAVVTDLRMPGRVSALELCRHFAQHGVPVVALTGVGPGREHDDMRAAGCIAILTKPVTPDRLLAEVRKILARGKMVQGLT
jgi:CheY-like chemotaxis protein